MSKHNTSTQNLLDEHCISYTLHHIYIYFRSAKAIVKIFFVVVVIEPIFYVTVKILQVSTSKESQVKLFNIQHTKKTDWSLKLRNIVYI